jgi:hypothetical protein
VIWGIGGAGTGTKSFINITGPNNSLYALYTSSPPLLPRVSVAYDGSYAMVGWILMNSAFVTQSKYPNVVTSTNVTGHAIDSKTASYTVKSPMHPSQPAHHTPLHSTAGSASSTGLPHFSSWRATT